MEQRRRQRRRGLGGVILVAALAIGGLGGCTLSEVPVVVAGYDTNGTLVVGATDCSFSGFGPDQIDLILDIEGRPQSSIWSIETDEFDTGSFVPVPSSLPPPPDPVPSSVDEVRLVSVGDPDPPGFQTRRPLTEPIPEGGQLTLEVDPDPDGGVWATLAVPRRSGPDRYSAQVGDDRIADISGTDLTAMVEETCDDASGFDGGLFLAVLGGTAGGLLVLAIPLGIVLSRQYKRAGTAARARRAGPGLPTAG
ncbi:MAG: hypothetical protein ACR2JF_00225 [Iamia sp.]